MNPDFTTTEPTCELYDDETINGVWAFVTPRSGQNQQCNYLSRKVPCTYTDRNWRSVSGTVQFVYELDIAEYTGRLPGSTGSTHELGVAPDGSVFVTNFALDELTIVQLPSRRVGDSSSFVEDIRMSSHPIRMPNGTLAGGTYGLHSILWPKHHKSIVDVAYTVFENANAIGIYDWKAHRVLRVLRIPLFCGPDGSDVAEGDTCTWTGERYACDSCIDKGVEPTASTTSSCPAGSHVHTIAEDAAGNVWAALKTGGLARLSLDSTWTGSARWHMISLSLGALPFYIAASPSGHVVWANSISRSGMYSVKEPTARAPTAQRYRLDDPSLYKGSSIPPGVDDALGCPSKQSEYAGPRPAGLVVLPSGAAVVALYNTNTATILILDSEHRDGSRCRSRTTALGLTEYYDGCFKLVPIDIDPSLLTSPGAFHLPAFLHVATSTGPVKPLSADCRANCTELWFLGSANDFETKSVGFQVDTARQPDEIYIVSITATRGMRWGGGVGSKETAHVMHRASWSRRFRAPTQASWLHRMVSVTTARGNEVLLATELKLDRLMLIVPAAEVMST